jgi:hypothetical protein
MGSAAVRSKMMPACTAIGGRSMRCGAGQGSTRARRRRIGSARRASPTSSSS